MTRYLIAGIGIVLLQAGAGEAAGPSRHAMSVGPSGSATTALVMPAENGTWYLTAEGSKESRGAGQGPPGGTGPGSGMGSTGGTGKGSPGGTGPGSGMGSTGGSSSGSKGSGTGASGGGSSTGSGGTGSGGSGGGGR